MCEAKHAHDVVEHGTDSEGRPGPWLITYYNRCQDEDEHEIHHTQGIAWL